MIRHKVVATRPACRGLGSALLAVLLLALSGCAILGDATPSTGVSTDDLKKRGTGILILGLGVLDAKPRSDSILAPTLIGISAAFYPVDPERSVARAILPLPVARRNQAQCLVGRFDPDCDFAQMRYVLLEVPEGEYGLFSFVALWGHSAFETAYSKQAPHISKPDVPVDLNRLVRWRVAAGELAYIGDLTFDAHAFPTKLARFDRNESAVARALAQYPNLVAGMMQFRLPVIGHGSQAIDLNAARAAVEAKAFETTK